MMEAAGVRRSIAVNVEADNTRLTTPIPKSVDRRIRRLAHLRGVTIAALVRPWIIDALEREEAIQAKTVSENQ